MRKLSLILICLLSFSPQLPAQYYDKGARLTLAEGLSDNRVTCIFRDREGFVWIGTRNGLNRYDGQQVTIFRPGPANSLSSEVIHDLEQGPDGRIWVATMNGLNSFDPATGKWENLVPPPQKSDADLPNRLVWDLWMDSRGTLWVASDVYAFASFDPVSRRFTHYDWPGFARSERRFQGSGNYHSIQRFVARDSSRFYLGTTKGLVELDIPTRRFRFLGGGYYGDVKGLSYDPSRKLVFLSVQGGQLFCYDETAGVYSEWPVEQEPYPSAYYRLTGEEDYWLSHEKGLLRIDPEKRLAFFNPGKLDLPGALLSGGVTALLSDASGIRWVGTPNGVSFFDTRIRQTGFLPLTDDPGRAGVNTFTSVIYDPSGDRYFVTAEKPAVVFVINRSTGEISQIRQDVSGAPFSSCYTLKQDKAGRIWLLTEREIYCFNHEKNGFERFPMPNQGKLAGFRDLVQDARGDYWVASFQFGVYRFDNRQRVFRLLTDSNAIYVSRLVSALWSDDVNEEVWIGTYGSDLHRYSLREQKLYSYRESAEVPSYAALNLVNDITADKDGTIWVATESGGLFRFHRNRPAAQAFTRYSMENGFPTNQILSMAPDERGRLWLLSGNGLYLFPVNGHAAGISVRERLFPFPVYSSDASIPHDIYYNRAQKKILVAAGGGLQFFFPDADKPPAQLPLRFYAMEADGRSITLSEEWATISRHTRRIRFSFAALYYGQSTQWRLEYRLAGYDTGWVQAGESRSAEYQNLSPGTYRFSLRAVDTDGRLLSLLDGPAFRIVPAFWQTTVFFIFLLAVFSILLYWITQALVRRVRRQEQLNRYATSLYGLGSLEDICWVTANYCVQWLGFEDCVVYVRDESTGLFVQRAAAGPKDPEGGRTLLNPLSLAPGKGIVGAVAESGRPERIRNTERDPRYLVDDQARLSELAVPVITDGQVMAVIDSEHSKKGFFTRHHQQMLEKMALIFGERVNKFLTEERLRSKIARDLHDEMGSTLTSINVLSKVGQASASAADQQIYFGKIKEHSAQIMESMSDLVWAINPENDSLDKVMIRMREFAAEMLEPAGIRYFFDTRGNWRQTHLNLEQRKDLYLIFKEAIHNAVKYSGATEIAILLEEQQGRLHMSVVDNGKGFDHAEPVRGNGLRNMKARARQMGGMLTIESIPGTGTRISLEKPLT